MKVFGGLFRPANFFRELNKGKDPGVKDPGVGRE